MLQRIQRAILLDPSLYRMVADDPQYANEGYIIAIVASILAGLGAALNSSQPVGTFFAQTFNGIVFGWIVWAAVAYFVGTNFFGGRSSLTEMLRTLGYANAPRFLAILGFIPCIGWLIQLAAALLALVAGVIAIRESMEFDTSKAIITALVGLVIYIIVTVAIGIVFAGAAAIGGALR